MKEFVDLLAGYKEAGGVGVLAALLFYLARLLAPWFLQLLGVQVQRGQKKRDKFSMLERRVGRLELFIETVHGISQTAGEGIAARMKARGWKDEGIEFFIAQLLSIPGLRQLAERDERENPDHAAGEAPKPT